jgi:hypothetical protein
MSANLGTRQSLYVEPGSAIQHNGEYRIEREFLHKNSRIIFQNTNIELDNSYLEFFKGAINNRSVSLPILRTIVSGNRVTVTFVYTDADPSVEYPKSKTIVWTFKRSRKGLLYLMKYVLYFHDGSGFKPVNISFRNGFLWGYNFFCIKSIRFNPRRGMTDNQALKLCANCIRIQALNSYFENVFDNKVDVSYIRSELFNLMPLM